MFTMFLWYFKIIDFYLFAVLFQLPGVGRPSVYHAAVVIFLEFFAWGLLTTPMLTVSIAELDPCVRFREVLRLNYPLVLFFTIFFKLSFHI